METEEKLIWKKINCDVNSFLSPYEDEVIHIIKKGHIDKYLVIIDSAHNENGEIETLTFKEIYNKYKNIILPCSSVR